MNPKAFNWYPHTTATVFASTNSGPWYKGASWANHVDSLPIKQRAIVIKEILDAITRKHPYTPLRPATPFEGMGQNECSAVIALDTKKAGDITLCNQPVSHTRYWAEGNHFMGRTGYCAKHVSELHGSDPTQMHALGESKPVVGQAGQPGKKKP